MPINPASFRFPYASLAKLPPEARDAHTATFNALTDIYQALALQKQNSSTSTTTVNETVVGGAGAGSGGGTTAGVSSFNGSTGDVSYFPDMFLVNNQTGQTAYTTQTGDAGAIIILDDSSSIAVGLNYSVATNWATVIANYGTGAATATPVSVPSGATSTITYPGNIGASSMPIPSGYAASVYFDGNDFWAVLTPITGVVGVTKIIAGTNVTISPVGGTGDVTINATTSGASRSATTTNANGSYWTWTDGVIEQWGSIVVTANTLNLNSGTITFPTSFVTAVGSLQVTVDGLPRAASSDVATAQVSAVSITGATVDLQCSVPTGGGGVTFDQNVTVYWRAIGV